MPRLASGLWSILKLALVASVVALGSCSTAGVILKTAPNGLPRNYVQPFPAQMDDAAARQALQDALYGRVVAPSEVRVRAYDTLDTIALEGRATLTQWQIEAGYGGTLRPLDLVLVMPNDAPDAPIILSQNFCPNVAVVPLEGVTRRGQGDFCEGGGFFGDVMTYVFGRHIVTPPLNAIIERGFGFAAVYPSQFVPDSAGAGEDVLDDLFDSDPDRPGALAVWAGLADTSRSLIEAELGPRPFIAYGHSRFGKTAILAGAWFDGIDGVIAHQSGTLGASRLIDDTGEPLEALIDAYPHWPNRRARDYAQTPWRLPAQPRDLLALLRDKPVLLGNARRDTWSDPFGAFVEAKSGWGERFPAQRPDDFRPGSAKAFWQRPGTHGVVKEDWEAFLAWLEAHYAPQ